MRGVRGAINTHFGQRPLVVHIIDALPPHGAERLLVDLVRNFSAEFRHEVICLEEGSQLGRELAAAGIPLTSLGYRGVFDFFILLRLYRWFRANRPLAVHTHLFTADFWGRLGARVAGVPGIFSTSHSVNSWKGMTHRFIDRILARLSTRIIACTSEVATILRTRDGIAEEKITVIANGIDMGRLAGAVPVEPAEFAITGPRPVMLALVGRLHPVKGHLDLLPVISELKREGLPFHLLFVGEGEQREEIKRAIIDHDLDTHVTLTGFREDIPAILAGTDILLIPSRWEGLPIVLLEAMAMGCAVLASAVGGIPDVLVDGENGYLAAPGDMAAFKAKLRSMILSRDIRVHLAENGRKTVRARYSVEAVCREYEALYRAVVGNSRGQGEGR